MPDGMTSDSALFVAVRSIAEAVQRGAAAAEVEQAVRTCFPLTRTASTAERQRVLAELGPVLRGAAAESAVLVGYLCGALLEDGVPPSAVEAPLVEVYLELARRAHSGDAAACELIGRASAPAIAVLSASPRARSLGRPLTELLAPLAAEQRATSDLAALAAVLDDEPYVALEPATLRGVRGRFSGLADIAQLHVLLMARFPRPAGAAPRVADEVVQNALGLGPRDLSEVVSASFTLYSYRAARGQELARESVHLLWNEQPPTSIPSFEGARAILLDAPPRYARSWRAQRRFLHLRAELHIDDELGESEVRELLEQMTRAARS
jgi:hypothetical protein